MSDQEIERLRQRECQAEAAITKVLETLRWPMLPLWLEAILRRFLDGERIALPWRLGKFGRVKLAGGSEVFHATIQNSKGVKLCTVEFQSTIPQEHAERIMHELLRGVNVGA